MSNLCLVCGNFIKRKNSKFCSRACYAEHRQHKRTCVICGTIFAAPPSSLKVCCYDSCSKMHRKQLHANGIYSETTQRWLSERNKYYDSHQGYKHPNAKYWRIQSPDDQVYEMTNLKDFIRQNIDLFDESTVQQAFDGFTKLKASKLGKRKRPSYTYKGWRLLDWHD